MFLREFISTFRLRFLHSYENKGKFVLIRFPVDYDSTDFCHPMVMFSHLEIAPCHRYEWTVVTWQTKLPKPDTVNYATERPQFKKYLLQCSFADCMCGDRKAVHRSRNYLWGNLKKIIFKVSGGWGSPICPIELQKCLYKWYVYIMFIVLWHALAQ